MICERCSAGGDSSDVWTVGMGSSSLAYTPSFWDDDGQQHDHDTNYHSQDYRCSNGHSWTFRHRLGCPAPGCSHEAVMESVFHDDYLDTEGIVR